MSNLDKASYGFAAVEVIWETIGWFSKIPTPGKGVARAVDWMFPDSKDELNKKVNKPKKEVNKPITTIDELREAIKNFAATKKSNTNDEEIKAYKKVLAPVYKKYNNCNKKLFRNYYDEQEMEYEGFKVVSSNGNYWIDQGGKQDDKCVFILKPGVAGDHLIRNVLNEIPQWKVLCDAAARLKKEIVIGIGLHEYRSGYNYMHRNLEGYINIGLKSDIENYNIYNFTNGNFSIFDFTFYDEEKKINNLNESNNLK